GCAGRDDGGHPPRGIVTHMDEPIIGIQLNDNQRRHFEVLLSRLEDSLVTIEALLAAPRRRQLTQLTDDVPPGFRTLAEVEIPQLREHVESLAVALSLRPNVVSLR